MYYIKAEYNNALYGGVISFGQMQSAINISDSIFSYNFANYSAGVIIASGIQSTFNITDCEFYNNSADEAGVMRIIESLG